MKLTVHYDDMHESPREWDNLGTMACEHSRYSLGDEGAELPEHDMLTDGELLAAFRSEADDTLKAETLEYAERWDCDLAEAVRDRFDDPREYPYWIQAALREKAVILPLYLYDHSGITMSTGSFGCPWDSGQVGIIWVSHEKIREEYGEVTAETIEKAERCLRGEVEVYDLYLRGNCFGFLVEDDDGEHVDSCGGFLVEWGDKTYGGMAEHMDDNVAAMLDQAFDNIGEAVEIE